MPSKTVIVGSSVGLHARPAAIRNERRFLGKAAAPVDPRRVELVAGGGAG
jgi:hypothetical protein